MTDDTRAPTVNAGIATLYQEMIIDHGRRPRNFGELMDATRTVQAVNPVCGDQLTLQLKLSDGVISGVAFTGDGCTISRASASLMTMAVDGLQHDEALTLFARVHTMLTTQSAADAPRPDVGKLAVLSGVWQYPARVKCATLAWQALRNALEADED